MISLNQSTLNDPVPAYSTKFGDFESVQYFKLKFHYKNCIIVFDTLECVSDIDWCYVCQLFSLFFSITLQ